MATLVLFSTVAQAKTRIELQPVEGKAVSHQSMTSFQFSSTLSPSSLEKITVRNVRGIFFPTPSRRMPYLFFQLAAQKLKHDGKLFIEDYFVVDPKKQKHILNLNDDVSKAFFTTLLTFYYSHNAPYTLKPTDITLVYHNLDFNETRSMSGYHYGKKDQHPIDFNKTLQLIADAEHIDFLETRWFMFKEWLQDNPELEDTFLEAAQQGVALKLNAKQSGRLQELLKIIMPHAKFKAIDTSVSFNLGNALALYGYAPYTLPEKKRTLIAWLASADLQGFGGGDTLDKLMQDAFDARSYERVWWTPDPNLSLTSAKHNKHHILRGDKQGIRLPESIMKGTIEFSLQPKETSLPAWEALLDRYRLPQLEQSINQFKEKQQSSEGE